jgi:hypothetical protein
MVDLAYQLLFQVRFVGVWIHTVTGTPLKVTLDSPMVGIKANPGNGWARIWASNWMSVNGTKPAKVWTKLAVDTDQCPNRRMSGDFAAFRLTCICCMIVSGSHQPWFSAHVSLLCTMVTSVYEVVAVWGRGFPGPVVGFLLFWFLLSGSLPGSLLEHLWCDEVAMFHSSWAVGLDGDGVGAVCFGFLGSFGGPGGGCLGLGHLRHC